MKTNSHLYHSFPALHIPDHVFNDQNNFLVSQFVLQFISLLLNHVIQLVCCGLSLQRFRTQSTSHGLPKISRFTTSVDPFWELNL